MFDRVEAIAPPQLTIVQFRCLVGFFAFFQAFLNRNRGRMIFHEYRLRVPIEWFVRRRDFRSNGQVRGCRLPTVRPHANVVVAIEAERPLRVFDALHRGLATNGFDGTHAANQPAACVDHAVVNGRVSTVEKGPCSNGADSVRRVHRDV